MGWILAAYWIIFLTGMGYAVISLFLGHLGLGHDGAHPGDFQFGHDFSAGESAGVGHGEAMASGGAEGVHFSPLSPMTIAAFMVGLGGSGVIYRQVFNLKVWFTVPLSAASGLLFAAVLAVILVKVFLSAQSSSLVGASEIVGMQAEVITPIPENGVGEIAYHTHGSRFNRAARAEGGGAIARQATVKITRVVGGLCYVQAEAPQATTESGS